MMDPEEETPCFQINSKVIWPVFGEETFTSEHGYDEPTPVYLKQGNQWFKTFEWLVKNPPTWIEVGPAEGEYTYKRYGLIPLLTLRRFV